MFTATGIRQVVLGLVIGLAFGMVLFNFALIPGLNFRAQSTFTCDDGDACTTDWAEIIDGTTNCHYDPIQGCVPCNTSPDCPTLGFTPGVGNLCLVCIEGTCQTPIPCDCCNRDTDTCEYSPPQW